VLCYLVVGTRCSKIVGRAVGQGGGARVVSMRDIFILKEI
jgi:hypothetical protein